VAIDRTIPAAAANPCTTRSTVSIAIDSTSTIDAETTTYSARAASSGRRRPNASDSDPMKSCPSARPASDAVSVSWTAAVDAPRSAPISGNAAR
jgi:hypothetical protein